MTGGRPVRIGIAGWGLRRELSDRFGDGASQLARYATRFNCVEINSCFYRPHRPATYARWADSVPDRFRFAVKMPRAITHEARLHECAVPLREFLDQTASLGEKRGPVLVQLPPSLGFDPDRADQFLDLLRARHTGAVVCEPRHPSWFTEPADLLLRRYQVARVAADPAPVPAASVPGAWDGMHYHRLHGSPRTYYSPYGPERLAAFAASLPATTAAWVILDNTALGEAIRDALWLRDRLG